MKRRLLEALRHFVAAVTMQLSMEIAELKRVDLLEDAYLSNTLFHALVHISWRELFRESL